MTPTEKDVEAAKGIAKYIMGEEHLELENEICEALAKTRQEGREEEREGIVNELNEGMVDVQFVKIGRYERLFVDVDDLVTAIRGRK